MHGIGRCYSRRYPEMVDVHLIDPGIDGALYIHFDTVAEHDAFRWIGPRFPESIIEDLLMRFKTIRTLRSDHLTEIVTQPRIPKFAMLGLLEPIGDKMQRITF